jgi:4-alpha-glucanotransferase
VDGLLETERKRERNRAPVPPPLPTGKINFPAVTEQKNLMLQAAVGRFKARADLQDGFQAFRQAHLQLEDSALYSALRKTICCPWTNWPDDLRDRKPEAIAAAKEIHRPEIEDHLIVQYLFDRQWKAWKKYCQELGIGIIGDVPIYVALDSAPVWLNRELFQLDRNGNPTVVSGVPPDYFNKDGQRWGNPLYRWDEIEKDGFVWWIQRIKHELDYVDVVRFDHVRGLEAYWEIEATEPSAKNGRWVQGPGIRFVQALRQALGGGPLPIIAEDLGDIDDGVRRFVRESGLPGMRVIQFGFGGDTTNLHLPHNYPVNCVCCPGTHDNDTTVGWWSRKGADDTESIQIEGERARVRAYLSTDGAEINWRMIEAVYGSKANTAIVPVQDLLGLGSEARMNIPGKANGNWEWQLLPDALTEELAARLRRLAVHHRRCATS